MEAEYRAMAIGTAEVYWLHMLLKELRIPLLSPPTLWCDNIGTLALASNLVYHARTKHIDDDYQFIREKVVNSDILVKFLSTHDQLANAFTKGRTLACFGMFRDKLSVIPPPFSLRGAVREKDEDKDRLIN
jgi:hypothetical protein